MKIIGHNDAEQARATASFIIPSVAEVTLLAVISAALLILANAKAITQAISDASMLGPATASETLQPHLEYLDNIFRKDVFGQLAVIVAWAAVGCLAYMAIWSLQHFLRRVKDDVDESKYTTPGAHKTYWAMRVGQYVYFACTAFLFLAFLIGFLLLVVPLASGLAEATIHGRLYLSSYLYLGLGLLLMMMGLYCLTRLGRGATYAFRSTFNSLD